MPYKGDNAILGYKIETAFDEAPSQGAQTTWFGIVPNADFADEPEFKDYWTINNASRSKFLENQGKINVTGTIPIELQTGRVIYLAMGGHGVSGGPTYTHTLSEALTVPSICIEAQYTGTNRFLRYFRGSKLNTLDIEAVDGGEVKASGSFACARSAKSANTASAITPVTTKPFMYHQGAMSIKGYADFNVTSFKWSVNNNLKVRHTVRQTDVQYAKLIIEGKQEYEMTCNIIIEDAATYNTQIYDDLIAGTLFTTTINLLRSATDQMTLTASNCTIRSAPHNIPEPGEAVEITVTMKPRTCGWSVIDSIATYV